MLGVFKVGVEMYFSMRRGRKEGNGSIARMICDSSFVVSNQHDCFSQTHKRKLTHLYENQHLVSVLHCACFPKIL